MDESTKRVWDVWLGFIAPILTVVGILIGIWQFNSGEENKARLEHELVTQKDNIDFHRKLWLEQVSTYRSIAELAGKIVKHSFFSNVCLLSLASVLDIVVSYLISLKQYPW